MNAIFKGMVCFDIASDKIGLEYGSIFIYMALISGLIFYLSFKKYYKRQSQFLLSSNNGDGDTAMGMNEEKTETTKNVLHEIPVTMEVEVEMAINLETNNTSGNTAMKSNDEKFDTPKNSLDK